MTTAAHTAAIAHRVRSAPRFYARMATTFIAVAVVGFIPTYWAPMARGAVTVTPLIHLHAFLFFGWLVFYQAQTSLAASGRMTRHRELGVAGVAIATAMLFIGMAASIQGMRRADAARLGAAGREFAIVSVSGVGIFAVLVAIGILNVVRNPELHKRFLFVATAAILQAPIGRLSLVALRPPGAVGPPPVARTIGAALVTDLLIVIAMAYDRRTRGRVHPAYWVAGASVLAVQLLRVPLSDTSAWTRVTDWLLALAP